MHISGVSVSTSERGHVHCYPYEIANPIGPVRTNDLFLQYARDALRSGSTVSVKPCRQ